jgi:hypothetical protein
MSDDQWSESDQALCLCPLGPDVPGPALTSQADCPSHAMASEPPVAPFGVATCLNCGEQFFPSADPNEMFCGPDCGQQYLSGLGL